MPESKALSISEQTHAHLLECKKAFERLTSDKAPEDASISRVPGLDGALCYDTGLHGKAAAIVVGTHMNELAGLAAAEDFHTRWMQGQRPLNGKVYVLIGGHVPTIQMLMDKLLATPPAITEKEFLAARSLISPLEEGPPRTLNHNNLPLALLDTPESFVAKEPCYSRIRRVTEILSECNAGVLDIHTTSQPSAPTASPFTQKGDGERTVYRKLAPVIENMPIKYITMFQEHNLLKKKPEDAGYDDIRLPLRAFAKVTSREVSLLVETGQHLDDKAFSSAVDIQRVWLNNVMGMRCKSANIKRALPAKILLDQIGKIYHPGALPQEEKDKLDPKVAGDHYFLIHSLDQLDKGPAEGFKWSSTAKKKIAEYKDERLFGTRETNRLGFYAPVQKGHVIAIGLETGHAVTAPAKGHVFMVNKNPDLALETDALGYFGHVSELQSMLDRQAIPTPHRAKLRTNHSGHPESTPVRIRPPQGRTIH